MKDNNVATDAFDERKTRFFYVMLASLLKEKRF
jgi:hypothetical protein